MRTQRLGSSLGGRNNTRWLGGAMVAGALIATTVGGCHRRAGEGAANAADAGEAAPAVPFQVRRESTELTFFWFDAHGTAHAASRVDEVPAASREIVRVDPAQPEQRAPGWVYVADLRAPGADGRFAVHAEPSEQFASELSRLTGNVAVAEAPPAPPGTANVPSVLQPALPSGGNQAAHITIYGASWCGACHQAAAYLRANNIPFIEHDIEREPQAAAELAERARQQGVPLGSIPIIDVNGRLMVGFNPGVLQQAIRGT